MKNKELFPLKRLVLGLVLLALLAVAVSLVVRFLNAPATTLPEAKLPEIDTSAGAEAVRELKGQYFSLVYSSTLDTASNISGNDRTSYELYRLSSTKPTSRRTLVVTIKPLPPDGLEGESSYLLRKRKSSEYTERHLTANNLDFTIFENAAANEQVAFITGENALAMLAYTVFSPGADQIAEFDDLLQGFSWL